MRPIGIDLFAGAGGFSLGFEDAGFDIAAAIDIDPIHCATHEFNFPHSKIICRSVLEVSGTDIRNLAGVGSADVAVVFGGAPCQGFSMIGKRAFDDFRNSLVYQFVRLVIELQPMYFVFENVKGITIGKHSQFLIEMINIFVRNRYRVQEPYRVLNAAECGVPQNRKRLFLIGAREDCRLPEYPEPSRERVTVAEAINDLPDIDNIPVLTKQDWVETEFGTPSDYARKLRGLNEIPNNFGYRRIYNQSILTSSLRTSHSRECKTRFAATLFGETEPISRFFKLNPDDVCNTIRSGTASDKGAFTSPRPIHPYSPRCITNREAARLQSFPDWFRFHVTKWHGFRQIGNSVPPILAQAVASQIMKALGETPTVSTNVLKLGNPALLALSMRQAAKRYGVPEDTLPKRKRVAKSGFPALATDLQSHEFGKKFTCYDAVGSQLNSSRNREKTQQLSIY